MSDLVPLPERRLSLLTTVSGAKFYILCAIALAALTVVAVVVVVALQPTNYMPLVTIIVGITSQMILGLLAAGGLGVVKVIDGNQTKLLHAIARKERAEGTLEGLKQNPSINIE